MSSWSKREYTEAIHLLYKNASHREKTAILDEFCAICGCHRKHAIRVLKGFKRFTKPRRMADRCLNGVTRNRVRPCY